MSVSAEDRAKAVDAATLATVEREAAAKALEAAAQHLRNEMDEPWGDRAANRVDVIAAEYREGRR